MTPPAFLIDEDAVVVKCASVGAANALIELSQAAPEGKTAPDYLHAAVGQQPYVIFLRPKSVAPLEWAVYRASLRQLLRQHL